MNKSKLKSFAIWARSELINQVKQRLWEYGIERGPDNGFLDTLDKRDRNLSNEEKSQRTELIKLVRDKGFDQVVEELAYTWFNRLIAIRFMEVNDYLPSRIRVLSGVNGEKRPEILSRVNDLDFDGMDMSKIRTFIQNGQEDEEYRYLLLLQCNDLNEILPRMFQHMGGYSELVLPKNILSSSGIIGRLVSEVPEEDWKEQVQIIGWLYQYYNTEPKAHTNKIKKKEKVQKENIPYVTQLFTPNWISLYLNQNSIGRIWINGHPNDELKLSWKYYMDEAEQEPEVQVKLDEIYKEYAKLRPEDITVLDPCMGSGHLLADAFDILVQIYKSAGVSPKFAVKKILENNLYGLDIDDRAAQLAYFSIMMKARQYDRKIFSKHIDPHLYAATESDLITEDDISIFAGLNQALRQEIKKVINGTKDAKNLGSILPTIDADYGSLTLRIEALKNSPDLLENEVGHRFDKIVKYAEILSNKYWIVNTNPPYMNIIDMNNRLSAYVQNYYGDAKSDLYLVFMDRCRNYNVKNGFYSMIVQNTWMFGPRYKKFRNRYLDMSYLGLLDLGPHGFDEISGEKVRSSAFVIGNYILSNYTGKFCRLVDGSSELEKEINYLNYRLTYSIKPGDFRFIPDSPFVYWIPEQVFNVYNSEKLVVDYADPKVGLQTGDNDSFLRIWPEVSDQKLSVNKDFSKKWFPCNKGGEYRKWYGNNWWVVNWENDGFDIKKDKLERLEKGLILASNSKPKNPGYYFKEGTTWSTTGAKRASFRYSPDSFMFEHKGSVCFPKSGTNLYYLMGLLNSNVSMLMLEALAPNIDFGEGSVGKIAYIDAPEKDSVVNCVKENISLMKEDWDSFEISWDFEKHPLLKYIESDKKQSILGCYKLHERHTQHQFDKLKSNEEELNKYFIDLYGLNSNLISQENNDLVSYRKSDLNREIKSLISYAVGCMFGRYSLDEDGIIYAGGDWDKSKYSKFIPDDDNIIPISNRRTNDEIVQRFKDWVENAFGSEFKRENLQFIASVLDPKKNDIEDVLNGYFSDDFYDNHLSTYCAPSGSNRQRPIYWLFDAGPKNSFKALIYMHRYTPDLLSIMRVKYIQPQLGWYREQITSKQKSLVSASSTAAKKLKKEISDLQDKILELTEYEKKIHDLAEQRIEIDLDDGVRVNYAKFADVLAPIK